MSALRRRVCLSAYSNSGGEKDSRGADRGRCGWILNGSETGTDTSNGLVTKAGKTGSSGGDGRRKKAVYLEDETGSGKSRDPPSLGRTASIRYAGALAVGMARKYTVQRRECCTHSHPGPAHVTSVAYETGGAEALGQTGA